MRTITHLEFNKRIYQIDSGEHSAVISDIADEEKMFSIPVADIQHLGHIINGYWIGLYKRRNHNERA